MISGHLIGLTYGASDKSIHFTLGFPLDFECVGPSLPLFDSISVETFKLYKNSSTLAFSSLHSVLTLARCVSLSRRRTGYPIFSHPTGLRLGRILLDLIILPLFPNLSPRHTP